MIETMFCKGLAMSFYSRQLHFETLANTLQKPGKIHAASTARRALSSQCVSCAFWTQAHCNQLAKTWWVHCEAIADTLHDVVEDPYLKPGKHVVNTLQITCRFFQAMSAGLLTHCVRALLTVHKPMANALRQPGVCIVKKKQIHCRM